MDVNEYRRRTPRCRTCQHVKPDISHYARGWVCTAKNKFHPGAVDCENLRGILCGLYKAKED